MRFSSWRTRTKFVLVMAFVFFLFSGFCFDAWGVHWCIVNGECQRADDGNRGGGGGSNPTPTAVPTATNTPVPQPIAPRPTSSRYIATINPGIHYNVGCARGLDAQAGVIVLDFGQPDLVGTEWGSFLFDDVSFAPIAEIETAVEAYIEGYSDCRPIVVVGQLVVAVGTNNYVGTTGFSAEMYYQHGRAWSEMINRLGDYISARAYGSIVRVAGANDIETDYSPAHYARRWAEGFDGVNDHVFYNFGDAGGVLALRSKQRALQQRLDAI